MTVLAIDQGTTGTTAVVYNNRGEILRRSYGETKQIYPRPGWVEHDPLEIWHTVVTALKELSGANPGKITALGITNQRETTIIWNKKTGLPVYNAIVWQCRRTAPLCASLASESQVIKDKTGLPLDAYFSATKIRWILDQIPESSHGDLLFGNVDSWLIWNLTGGSVHATDFTNASRTMLFNIDTRQWDDELCRLFGIPSHLLPEVRSSRNHFGDISSVPGFKGIPILSCVGDQQASLFGQGCVEAGQIKNTYGTGCFIMMNNGRQRPVSRHGLIATLALGPMGQPCFALEGSVFIAGAILQFLRDELKIIDNYDQVEEAARAVADNAGVYLVPAFVGLGAPHWDMEARGIITGLTRGSNRNHLIRAALEAMAYQTADIVAIMEQESGITPDCLLVDGGGAKNSFLTQFQADILNLPVRRSAIAESTSLGAALLAGLQAGIWKDQKEISDLILHGEPQIPAMDAGQRQQLLAGWQKAVRQTRTR